MKLSILIPVYNEERNILEILDKIQKVKLFKNISKQIVIVNDNSNDKTEELIFSFIKSNKQAQIDYKKHKKNQGKGKAINTALEMAEGDFIIFQDADNEYDPDEYNLLLAPILEDKADVVYGSRFIGGKPHRILFFWHTIGNNFLTFLSNMFQI